MMQDPRKSIPRKLDWMHATADERTVGDQGQAEENPQGEYPLWFLFSLFSASGFAALIYQVMWMRSFGLVFGSSTRAAAIVLAAFFFGMALGNWQGGRLARSRGLTSPRSALVCP